MPSFSKKSLERLATCDIRLQKVFLEVIKEYDCTILCGHRGEQEQNDAFAKGNSKLKYPNSKHNSLPSKAVDAAPWPIDWNDLNRFKELAEVVLRIAASQGTKLTYGGSWVKFPDYPHFQLED